ncbi:hypothetical protein [Paenibacillus oceani]|uniref:Fumarate reductase/succinate dehydrogenase flavoprotein-like C-terminal domain-containing protein n=1 Tax=Paenibacillus oceani TaxID=2772510 RepID=A0A927CEX7_9BACL|nr:hypothetical protein [Paenibacillus oceani]MBD2865342.1 hypothetical protein [Paenibacillus oceani]
MLPLVEKVEADRILQAGEAIILGALERKESRGAHVRLDYEDTNERQVSYTFRWNDRRQWEI